GYMAHACVKCAPHKPTSRTLLVDFSRNIRKATCGHSEHVFKWRSSWRGPVESITISSALSSNIQSPSSLIQHCRVLRQCNVSRCKDTIGKEIRPVFRKPLI